MLNSWRGLFWKCILWSSWDIVWLHLYCCPCRSGSECIVLSSLLDTLFGWAGPRTDQSWNCCYLQPENTKSNTWLVTSITRLWWLNYTDITILSQIYIATAFLKIMIIFQSGNFIHYEQHSWNCEYAFNIMVNMFISFSDWLMAHWIYCVLWFYVYCTVDYLSLIHI